MRIGTEKVDNIFCCPVVESPFQAVGGSVWLQGAACAPVRSAGHRGARDSALPCGETAFPRPVTWLPLVRFHVLTEMLRPLTCGLHLLPALVPDE